MIYGDLSQRMRPLSFQLFSLTAGEKRRQDKVDLAHSCVKQVLLDAFEKTDYRGEKKAERIR